MLPYCSTSSSADDGNYSIIGISTGPTTPNGSLTFSPTLQALKLDVAVVLGDHIETSAHHIVKNVCFVGAGYVGGPTAAVLALQNPRINFTVFDKNSLRIKQWKSRHLPIHEPGLPEIVRMCRDGSKGFSFFNGTSTEDIDTFSERAFEYNDRIHIPARAPNLVFSDDIEMCVGAANLIMIAVDTPTKSYGIGAGKATDMEAVGSVIQAIGRYAKPGTTIVEKSTVPGRTGDFIKDTLKIHRPHETFPVISNPEFLTAGTAVNDLLYPDRILIGASRDDHRAAESLASLYNWIPSSRIIYTSTSSSELAKLVSNAMLAQRISSINSISAICEFIGADVEEVSESVGMDRRIGDGYLKAGIGFGGSCFRKDISSLMYLAEGLGLKEVAMYWESVLMINEWQRKRWVKTIVEKMGGGLKGKKVVVLGYTFKRGTGDVRESLARDVIETLGEERPREIVVWDGGCEVEVLREELKRLKSSTVEEDLYTACDGADAVLICRELEACSKGRNSMVEDPRPLTDNPSEMELLNLQNFLSSNSHSNSNKYDTLGRLYPEPAPEAGKSLDRTLELEVIEVEFFGLLLTRTTTTGQVLRGFVLVQRPSRCMWRLTIKLDHVRVQ
ncbi:hypothetical protein DSL72_004737 [Monilinia vaccinii-corymbosi]|uniref:UDP-glucose 6-dehydrogenase n=1 Tax=Monilinia vaccinii-corymbosi TaxID=61207 RepID=A0A8A3NX23_9HELO|nr:hypothetical protein DSL72_004737 [Monilinia vaccinii-corymbosi]